MTIKTKIRKIGNSNGIILNSTILEHLNAKVNDEINIRLNDKGAILMKKKR